METETDYNIFYIRNNFKVPKFRKEIFVKSQAAILVDQDFEKADWNLLMQGEKKQHKGTQFIDRWIKMEKSLKKKDALLVSSYLGENIIKIGLLSKNSTFFEHPENKDFKVFQMEKIVELNQNEHQILSSLIPAQTTLSPIHQRTNFIISKYLGTTLPVILENLSPTSVELMCMEWLRTGFAPIEFQLKYQLLKAGGNFPNIDIYGVTKEGKEIAAQVTVSNNRNTVIKKLEKLSRVSIEKQVMFCDIEEGSFEISVISIRKVFRDLYSNGHKVFLEKLVNQ